MSEVKAMTEPPEGAIQIGPNAWYTKILSREDEWIAIDEWHRLPNGNMCGSWIPFDVPAAYKYTAGSPKWQVASYEPLTLSPSLLCNCGDHGFIRDGKWVPA